MQHFVNSVNLIQVPPLFFKEKMMKLNSLISLAIFAAGSFANSQSLPTVEKLECLIQMFYPKDRCGNCNTVDRRFTLQGSEKKQEVIELSALRSDAIAINKVVKYKVTLDSGRMIHYGVQISDKTNRSYAQSALPYQPAHKGLAVNLGTESGITFSLFCNPK
jgi:hypothetical protein